MGGGRWELAKPRGAAPSPGDTVHAVPTASARPPGHREPCRVVALRVLRVPWTLFCFAKKQMDRSMWGGGGWDVNSRCFAKGTGGRTRQRGSCRDSLAMRSPRRRQWFGAASPAKGPCGLSCSHERLRAGLSQACLHLPPEHSAGWRSGVVGNVSGSGLLTGAKRHLLTRGPAAPAALPPGIPCTRLAAGLRGVRSGGALWPL